MDIQIPPELQWVSYLAGGEWPQGSETRTRRIGEHYQAAAEALQELIPDLSRVRGETMSVLFGDTAEAAEKQFAMLFDGDYTVDKLAEGISGMGEGATNFSSEIEYSKLSIIVGLALAAAEISYSLAMSSPTLGASTAAIPVIETTTIAWIRALVAWAIRRIGEKMAELLTRTMMKRLLHEGFKESGQELAQGLLQEGIVQGIQANNGHADFRWDRFKQTAIASTVGGGAGGMTAVPMMHGMGHVSRNRITAGAKGAVTMFTAGVTGNVAGTLSVGGEFDTLSILASSTSTSLGGMKGLGRGQGGQQTDHTNPAGLPGPDAPNVGLRGDDPDGKMLDTGQQDDDGKTDSSRTPQNDSTGQSAAPAKAGLGRGGGSQTNNTTPQADSKPSSRNGERHNAVDESTDQESDETPDQADAETDTDTDAETQHAPADRDDQQHSPNPQPDNGDTADIPADEPAHTATLSPDQEVANPQVHAATTDVPQAAVAAEPVSVDPGQQVEGAHVAPEVAEAPQTIADPVQPQQAPVPEAPEQHGPPVVAAPSSSTTTVSPATPATTPPTTPPATPTTAEPATKPAAAKPDSKPTEPRQAPPTAQPAGPESQVAGVPTARVQPTAQNTKQDTPQDSGEDVVPAKMDSEVTETGGPRRGDQNCVFDAADDLSSHFRKQFQVDGQPTATGMPARALYQAVGSRADFATYAEIEATLRGMEPGSAAVITSAWAGDGQRQGGHAYVAVFDGKDVYLLHRGERQGWPPSWGQSAVSTTAVGYLDAQGNPVNELGARPDDLDAAIAVGDVQGTGDQAPGEQWRDVTPQSQIADEALAKRVPPVDAGDLRNPLGLMESADARARANAAWWAGLSGPEQRALIDVHPQHIGNAEGIPPGARHEANTQLLEAQRAQLKSLRGDGHRLTRAQSKMLARLDRIHSSFADAQARAQDAGVDAPMLLAFDVSEFGGHGRAVVSFGDPYRADSVSWHVPGQGTTIDRIGACMDGALDHLQATLQANPGQSVASIAWLGYDAPSGWSSWRVAGHGSAREGGAVLYSDIRGFNAARDTWAGDGSHFTDNHIFAHGYGTTAVSYAGRDGRLANDIRTVTLTDSPGAGPVRRAAEFGIGADNVYVASTSRDVPAVLAGRTPVAELSIGVDPWAESFGANRETHPQLEPPSETDVPALEPTTPAVQSTREIADEALAQRDPSVSAKDVVNPLGVAEDARTRAEANVRWWSGLSEDQRDALVKTYPAQIGNSEGIPPATRDLANRTALRIAREHVQHKLDRGEKLTKREKNHLLRMNRLDTALRTMGREAADAGIDPPLVLAFDPPAFGGDGRAVVSFGADPYLADSVSWLVPGFATTIDKLEGNMRNALNHLQSTLQENPTLAATSIAWIGYDAPNGAATGRVVGPGLARQGAEILYSDIRAFNAARDTAAGDGSHFRDNHIFAHSYGSTTASYAGRNGRLADDIRTVTLLGSPGAGPMRNAGEFGIGNRNVFVASSSLDPVTGLGGRVPGQDGRFAGRGLGMDPAMKEFEAVRITAQFPASMNDGGSVGTHRSYYRYMDGDADPRVRTESLANFGRIAAGHPGRLHQERHRTVVDGRTVDPAEGRALRLDSDNQSDQPGERRPWNPRWHPAEVEPSAAQVAADQALGQRIPPVGINELVTPLGDEPQAVARAQANAAWWSGLNEQQRSDLITAYPYQIGNAEGIPAADRDTANRRVLQRYLDQAADIQAQIDAGNSPNSTQLDFLLRVNRLEHALQRAQVAAQQAGVGDPFILAFDPPAFGGDGRVLVSFGTDPYIADSVSWYVPGMGAQINKLDYLMHCALNILQSTRTENPSLSAASIAWLGYDAPNNSGTVRVGSTALAEAGGDILHADISAFNATRDAFAGDGSHFTGNHLFGHSYGSTTTCYAGRDGRLAEHVSTITLLGSPGAGPLQQASDFGIDPRNVFVASSSRDFVTGLGGRTADSTGRLGRGLGTDPAMDTFGAQRVRAEFPASMDRKDTTATHNAYFDFQETDGPGTRQWLVTPANAVPSESLANLGRIASGHTERLDHETHRSMQERPGRLFGTRRATVEPAANRSDNQGRNWWNPRWRDADIEVEPQHAVTEPNWTSSSSPTPHAATKAVADAALSQRIPPGEAADLVNPLGRAGEATARAKANAQWWAGLNDTQQQALINTYPARIGNAEGIPPVARDAANRLAIKRFQEHVQSMIDRGVRPGKNDLANLLRVNRLDAALQAAAANAVQAGVGGPMVLSLDPFEFGGDGRAVVSFGADPYQADSVSWLVPGFATTVDKLEGNMRNALNHVRSTVRENPTLAATSIAWIGYDAPNGMASGRVLSPKLARAGAEILYSDIRAFNVARNTLAADGSEFTGNHVFGHSYGSTTVSYAGIGGRLKNDIRTVTLLGSPGAGPMHHAGQFGLGDGNVFVASSSKDPVTGFGGRRAEQDGRFAGRGLGMDPAMDEFGAVRVTSEFPAAVNTPSTFGTHKSYHHHVSEGDGAPVRNESLANSGRIAAGRTDRLHHEGYRRVVDGRTVDPAVGRPLRLDDDTQVEHEGPRRPWNPRWRAGEIEPSEARLVADEALAQRIPPLAVDDLVHPLGRESQAVARARNNAAWWSGLSPDQQQALLQEYPHQIGNAEGIPSAVRDIANREMLRQYAERAAAVQARIDAGENISDRELDFVRRVNRLENAMQRAEVASTQAGEGHPLLLALDPGAFGGDGRALVSFGADPYTADSVSWYVPGLGSQLDKLDYIMHCALNIQQSTRAENPSLASASIAWLGYDAPNDSASARVARPGLARAGGEMLYTDISTFNAVHDAFSGDGSHFTGNHVFGHSYGSTTTGYAGAGGRLAPHITTVTLVGSPGAGPLRSAGDFGIDTRNVFVASSSRDFVTGLGGRTSDSQGRFGIGLGTDPAMDTFGGQRISAEFPASMDRKDTLTTHNAYFDYLETDGPGTRQWLVTPQHAIRTESLTNFGRIAAGNHNDVHAELHRTVDESGSRTVEPAASRPAMRLDDDPGVMHPTEPHNRNRVPRWTRGNDCAQVLAQEVSTRTGRDIPLDAAPSRRGTSARAMFRAFGTAADFATYAQIEETLLGRPSGSMAVMASRWSGGQPVGHAYMAVHVDGRVYLFDPHTRQYSGWPPHWGQDAVAQTAVGYLRSNGEPVVKGRWYNQFAAAAIGRVQGLPDGQAHGNTDGLPAADRDTANRNALQHYRDRADHIRTKLDQFSPVSREERAFLERIDRLDLAVRQADADAARAGLQPPLVLVLDTSAFSGGGHAVISFGADPYHASRVTWHTARGSIEQLGTVTVRALDGLHTSTGAQDSATIAWIGDTSALHRDLAAFHETRRSLGEPGPFTGNHVVTHAPSSTSSASRPNPLSVAAESGAHVVAHRGASHDFPEQTRAAYTEALRQGADALECDVRLTKDGELVLIHDKTVDRTSNGTGRVGDMTLAELQALDFDGHGILTLDEFIQLAKDADRPVTLFIETKHPAQQGLKLEREVVAALERHGLANPGPDQAVRAAVISFYPDALLRVRSAAPNVATVLLGASARYLAGVVGASAIGPSIETLRNNPELVGAAAARGLATYCWTVNNEADVQFARDLGVDWVATDHPGRTGTLVGEQTGRQEPGTAPTPTEPATDEHVRQIADDALSRRIPPVRPDELRNPMGPAEEAAARATNNARWWSGLTDEQRSAIVETYPQHIGNAEGISAADRDRANRNVLQQMREQADALQSKADRGERLSGAERKFLRRMDKLDLALRKATVDAQRAGVDGPLLLAFDPAEFGGDGRAVLSYGADPYTADSVSWHVPGVGSTVDTLLGFNTTSALHHLQAVQQDTPGLSAASIAWIGYDAPSGWSTLRAAGHGMARTGGDILYSDIRAFNTARDTLAGDGSHFTGNHVFGYSYGSTTAGYAGLNGRFAGHVRTVSLVGSPGVGPVRTADEFGIGADNVFVASSSRDVVTALGGRTSGSSGRVFGIGLGTDPAMDSFGAVRVTAEPSVSMNRLLTGGTHHTYFLNTEATTNLGRVAAGRTDAVTTEQHRTELGRSRHAPLLRTVEPAADRVGGRRFWNALWRRPPNCAVTVTEELSTLFGRTFELDSTPSRRGVPARALFRAVGADARFTTYDEVEAALLGDPSLRVAVLTSQWTGGRQGGHAYLAVKVDGQVQLYDPHTRKYSPWPPHWGQHAVTQTAVGYLQTNGDPVGPMTSDVPLQLDAADAVGNVQGPQQDPEFAQRQAEYRAQDPATRVVDTRYAEPMGDVVDNASDHVRGRQLAQDLSGRYGPYRIQLRLDENLTDVVLLTGEIFDGDKKIGTIQRQFNRDPDGTLVAAHTGLVITDENLRGKGFSKALTSELERFYVRSGIDRIELTTHDKGGFAWARRGYAWDPRTNQLQESLDRVKQSARQLRETVSDEAKAVLDQVVQQLDPSNPRLPEPIDLANLATTAEPDLGQRLLDGTGAVHGRNGVHYVKYLDPASVAPARTGLKGWLQSLFGRSDTSRGAADNCAYGVANELSRIYPGRFHLSIPPSATGVPAWALFQAAQSRSQFANYADIEAELLGRPAGSSAIVVSRWAADGGRQGGHAYLAVTDGRQVQLYDPRTRQYSPWPPHWGESAVDRTAVGYLNQNGDPVHPISDEPVQVSLRAADSIGDVKGHPAADDFLTRQQQYRAQDPTTRRVDSTYAQPLGQIVDSFDTDQVQQLAADLSGVYGPYRVEMFRAVAEEQTGKVIIGGAIISGDEEIGFTQQTYVRDRDGSLVAHQNVVDIPDKAFRGKGFAKAFVAQLDQYYALSGVDRIELRTEQDGGYAWARQGFSWNPDPAKLRASVDNVRNSALRLRDQVSPEAQALLDDVVRRLDPSRPDLPEPIDLAALATDQEPHLGRDLLTNTYWSGVKYVAAADAVTPAVDTRHAEPLGDVISESMDQDRAQRLADDLSGMYGPYRVRFSGEALPNALQLKGEIFSGARRIGEIDRIFIRDESGNLVAHHNEMTIENEAFRGKGFSKAFLAAFDHYYTRSGVDRIELLAVRDGAYASARRGFSWDLRADELQESLDSVKAAAQRLLSSVTAEARVVLEEVIGRLEPGHPRLPEPADLANLTADGHPELGRELLSRTSWYGIKYVDEIPGSPADAVGDVQGHPDDREFLARQQEYRAQDPADRAAESRYAEPVGDVVDNASDPQRVDQLAADLSGVYGPFRVELQRVPDEATGIAGYILSAGKQIGMIYWSYHRDAAGNLVAEHGMIEITSASHRGKGFSKALAKQLEPLYARSGVERIEMEAAWDGAYAWASWGFSWAPDPVKLQNSLDSIRNSAQKLRAQVGPEAQAVLDEVVQRLHPDHPRLPEPLDLARLTAPGHPDLGKKLLTNTNWHAVRYLDVEAVDSVGDVQGHPDAPDFAGQQQEYRSQDPATRRVDTRYAEHLREVVDSFDREDVRQLAEDLSGQYGPYQVEFSPERIVGGERFTLHGLIRSGDTEIGYLTRKFSRDEDGNLVVENTIIRIERAEYRGQDFSKALTSELEQYYVRSGVDRIELVSKWQGSNAWARRGFTWSTDVYHLHQALDVIRDAALRLRAHVGTEAQAVLDDIVTRLEVGHPRMPEPIDLAMLATAEEPELGRKLLDNTSVHFVKYLPGPVVADTQPSARNCAYGVADELSARYGRPFRIEVEPTRSGVPARALYEAVGSSSRFATYDQVEESLRRLGDGSSAVLTSRWTGGRSGGHAYLAVNDGGEIFLIDPTTGERTGWPPHWGQGAVDRTAVGYLDANGDAVNPLHDVPLRLGTADSVGNVKGLPAEPPTPAHVADEALGQRVLPDPGTAVENARANAMWWKGLSADQRQALIATYPVQIGNAEGVPPLARHEANTRVLHDWLAYRDGLQAKLNSDIRLGFEKKLELLRINSIEAALERGAAAAQRAGVDGPYLLRLDTGAFHGAGMAVVSFGVDPYLAESVVWNIPGRGMTIQELGPGMGTALNHATSALLEDPTASVASMTWIGYDTMLDDGGRTGGDVLFDDIRAFNAGRTAWSEGGIGFGNNHVFGHCLGSAVAGYAGVDARLDGEIRTVTLYGSPGLGPMNHAGEFGPGVDVYVATASTDSFTQHGGTTPGARGDFRGGHGVDPAMDFFGAQRVTSEFPLTLMTKGGDYDIHNFYSTFVDKDAGVRNESLANFGRVIVGHIEHIQLEGHRTLVTNPDQTTKVLDPAAMRSVRLDDVAPAVAAPADNCAYGVADVLSQRYGREFRITAQVTSTGVAARSLFEAVGSGAHFASYAEVAQRLRELGPGSSAVLASRWAGMRQGGHAYLAVNDGGEIYLIDRRTGERAGWPPHWGQVAVDRTAAGFLDADGNAVDPLADVPLQLAAAEAVGDVRGLPRDPDYLRRQEQYRSENRTTRVVDTRYADPLAELVDNPDPQRGQQLAEDLSGMYGPYRVEFEAEAVPGSDQVALAGVILHGNRDIGSLDRVFHRDDDGNLVVHHGLMAITDPRHRGQGFSKALSAELERFYVRSGVDRIELTSDWQGSNAWARRGFTWGPDLMNLQGALDQIKMRAADMYDGLSAEGQAELDQMLPRLEVDHPRLPEPVDIAILETDAEPNLGRRLLENVSIDMVKYLPADPLAPLGLPQYAPGTLSEGEAIAAFGDGENKLRALNEELMRDGVSAEERARRLSDARNALRSWAYGLMSNREAAEFLLRNTTNPTFDDLVARNAERGLTGDAIYEAIIDTSTHSRMSPGSLTDIETGAVYSQFELGMRALDEQMIRDGVSIEDRARILSGLRSSLRAWTRELMENRPAADWLSAHESAPTFEDLVARYEGKGLSGDDVYQAIIDGATHSHYAAGTLSDEETRTVYTTYELRMRELRDQLLRDGVSAEERARTMYGMRATIRSWTRSLMADRRAAEWLNENEPNPTFDELVERNRAKGRVGDEIYEAIVASSTRSRGSVNADLGIDPDNPPDLPPMRGPHDDRPQDQEEDTT
ncbi:alpha/beta hydrolase [Mycolicibacterium setense]